MPVLYFASLLNHPEPKSSSTLSLSKGVAPQRSYPVLHPAPAPSIIAGDMRNALCFAREAIFAPWRPKHRPEPKASSTLSPALSSSKGPSKGAAPQGSPPEPRPEPAPSVIASGARNAICFAGEAIFPPWRPEPRASSTLSPALSSSKGAAPQGSPPEPRPELVEGHRPEPPEGPIEARTSSFTRTRGFSRSFAESLPHTDQRPRSFIRPNSLHLAALLLFFILAWLQIEPALAAITLVSFTPTPGDRQVTLLWETATEFNNSGFFIHSSLAEDGEYQVVSPFIPAQGEGITGGVYTFTHSNLTNGTTYYYKLEAVDSGNVREFYGSVISAVPGAPTPSPTLTLSPTPTATGETGATFTPTPTSTQPFTSTPTPTRTLLPAYPGPVTNTPVTPFAPQTTASPTLASPTPNTQPVAPLTSTVVLEPTATLIPLPTITILFPAAGSRAGTAAAPELGSLSGVLRPPDAPGLAKTGQGDGGPRLSLLAPLALILLIWVGLGGWLYFALRKVS